MSQEQWLVSLVVAAVVVVVVALLLGIVIALLKNIDRHAAHVATAGKEIVKNTVALWVLEQVQRDLVAVRDAARGIEHAKAGGSVSEALKGAAGRVRDVLPGSGHDHDEGR